MLTKRDFMILHGIIMLQSLQKTHCKREAAKSLGMSTDTFNKYVQYLEDTTKQSLVIVDEKGSHLTLQGSALANIADKIEEYIRAILEPKPNYMQIREEQIDQQISSCKTQMNFCSLKLDFENALLLRNRLQELQRLKSNYGNK